MTLIQNVKTCFKKSLHFKGRATNYIFQADANGQPVGDPVGLKSTFPSGIFGTILGLVRALPVISIGWLRMRDVGKSGCFPYLTIFAWILTLFGMLIAHNGFGATIDEVRGTDQAMIQINSTLGLAIFVAFILVPISNIRWLASPSLSGTQKYGPNPQEALS